MTEGGARALGVYMSEEAREEQDGSGIPLVFGRVLKRLRVQAGMERAELGRRTGY